MRFAGRILGISLAWLLGSQLAWATPQVLFGGRLNTSPNTGSDSYVPLARGAFGSWTLSDVATGGSNTTLSLVSTPGTIQSLRVTVNVAPGAGTSYQFTVRQNATDTALTCSIADSSTSCTDSSSTVAVVGGDLLSLEASPANTPASVTVLWTVVFDSTASNEGLLLTGSGAGFGTIPVYTSIDGENGSTTSLNDELTEVVPVNGTLKNLYVQNWCTPDPGSTITTTVMLNGSTTALTCSFGNGSRTCNDTTNMVTVAVNDLVQLKVDSSTAQWCVGGSNARPNVGVTFTPSDSSFVMYGGIPNGSLTTDDTYYPFPPLSASGATSESSRQLLGQATTIGVIRVLLVGAGSLSCGPYVFTTRVNGADTSNSCTIAIGETACVGTTTTTIADGDLVSLEINDGTCTAGPLYEYTKVSWGLGSAAARRLFRTY